MNKETGGPAFPTPAHNLNNDGMTLRDYFAAALVTSGTVFKSDVSVDTPELVAKQAYELADAMIKERRK